MIIEYLYLPPSIGSPVFLDAMLTNSRMSFQDRGNVICRTSVILTCVLDNGKP